MKQAGNSGARISSTAAAIAVGLAGVICVAFPNAGEASAKSPSATPSLQAEWRATISATPLPGTGCFTAHFPGKTWTQVACSKVPERHYYPAHGAIGPKVGNGRDDAAGTSSIIASAIGSFPSIKGLTSVSAYSLQLNSQYFSSPLCESAQNPLICQGWQQFIYAPAPSGNGLLFMQYWLINYGPKCPSGWFFGGIANDCSANSNGVQVPPQSLSQLGDLQLSAAVVSGSDDTIRLVTSGDAYSTTGADSLLDLSGYWNAAEYNIFGNGEDSEAMFNKGTKIEVQIQLQDGTTAAPVCESNAGTTGETNNLKLGKCKAKGGTTPSIAFRESN